MREGWLSTRISEVARVVTGTTPPGALSDNWGTGIPFLTPSDMSDSDYQPSAARALSNSSAERMKNRIVQSGGVAVVCIGATIGKVARLTMPTLTNQQINTIVPIDGQLDSDFAFYLMRIVAPYLRQIASGSATPLLNKSRFEQVEITIPPIAEQSRIAGVLGILDESIEANKTLSVLLDQLGMALFLKTWDGSATANIGSLGEVIMGQSPPGSTLNEEKEGMVFYQGVTDFGSRYPNGRVFCVEPTRLAKERDILIAVRAPVGDTNVAIEETAIGRGIAALRAIQPAIALRALRAAKSTWDPYQGTGTVFSSITGPDLRGAKVPYVSDVRLEALLATLDSQHLALSKENEQLTSVRDELLPLLLSGAITVKEDAA